MEKSNCILWSGAISKKGYGVQRVGGKPKYVHRIAYEKAFGAIPRGMLICHKCDVRNCINPDHLFLGTAKDNTQDMTKKGRGLYGRDPISVTHIKYNTTIHYKSQRECAKDLGVNQATVSYALRKGSLISGLYRIVRQRV